MSDDISLRIMCLFEAGARMYCDSELVSLAALLHHKFFKARQDVGQHEQFTFAAACLGLAAKFYERDLEPGQLVSVMASLTQGIEFVLQPQIRARLVQSVALAERVILLNLNFRLDYKADRRLTPGDLQRMRAGEAAAAEEAAASSDVSSYCEELDNQDNDLDVEDDSDEENTLNSRLLRNNNPNAISAHRYLAHYLKAIQLLVEEGARDAYARLCNVAWILLSDFHWSSTTLQHQSNHLACACLMLAVEACKRELDCPPVLELANLWRLVNRRWHLILCDDLNQRLLKRLMMSIINQYEEYERVLEHELNVFVIDPKSGQRTFSRQQAAGASKK